MKTMRLLNLALGAAVICLPLSVSAQAPQKSGPPPRPQTQLEDRVKELEARLNAAEQKAASAAMEKDYITRVQKQYEAYYEKAFNTQVAIVSTLAVFISIVLWIAARFGFETFDRRIATALRDASTQLRTEFNQQLRTELDALRTSNAAQLKALEDGLTNRITEQEQDLKTRSEFQSRFAYGLASGADERHADARQEFRRALATYKFGRARQVIARGPAASAARNLFLTFEKEDQAEFVENAKKELADDFYNDLQDELARAAIHLAWLAPLLKGRK